MDLKLQNNFMSLCVTGIMVVVSIIMLNYRYIKIIFNVTMISIKVIICNKIITEDGCMKRIMTMDQVNVGSSININSLQKGDLVFFKTNPEIPNQVSHAGIYVGNNKFIQSPKTGDFNIKSILSGYYKNTFVIGKRLVK